MSSASVRAGVAALVLVLSGCASEPAPPHPFDGLLQRPGVVTLTDLHPDEISRRLYAVNYQQMGLIPVCSPVTLLELSPERLLFRVEATGETYEYRDHDAATESFRDHLARYFGETCPAALRSLDEIDQRGVRLGKPLEGMSKQGVLLAMGYPPPHVNPSLSSNRWIYWTARFTKLAVVFDDAGHVLAVDQR